MWFKVLKTQFKSGKRIGVFLALNFLILVAILLAPNINLVKAILTSSLSLYEKFTTIGSLLGILLSNNTLFSASLTLAVIALLSLNLFLLASVLKGKYKLQKHTGALGIGGMVSGLLGIGCASCGSLLLPFVGGVAGVGIVAMLPFHGLFISILGLALLIFSNNLLIKQMSLNLN